MFLAIDAAASALEGGHRPVSDEGRHGGARYREVPVLRRLCCYGSTLLWLACGGAAPRAHPSPSPTSAHAVEVVGRVTGGSPRAVATSAGFTFVVGPSEEGVLYAPLFAVPDDADVAVALEVGMPSTATLTARELPLRRPDPALVLAVLTVEDRGPAGGSSSAVHVLLRRGPTPSLACRFPGGDSHWRSPDDEPALSRQQVTFEEEAGDARAFRVRVAEQHRSFEGHSRELDLRYVVREPPEPCERVVVGVTSNDEADYRDHGLPVPSHLRGEEDAPLARALEELEHDGGPSDLVERLLVELAPRDASDADRLRLARWARERARARPRDGDIGDARVVAAWTALIALGELRDGMSLAEAIEILGAPDSSGAEVRWYVDPERHVSRFVGARPRADGTLEGFRVARG